jgi:hypothetical protein
MTEGPGMQEWNKGLRKKSISGRIFSKTIELEIEKRRVGSSTWLWEVSD